MKNKTRIRGKRIFAVLICVMLGICGCSGVSVADGTSLKETGQELQKNTESTEISESSETGGETKNASDSAAGSDEKEPDEGNIVQTASQKRTDLFSSHGKLSVKGTQLVDKNKKPFQLRGISTHGLSWFPQYVNKEGFKTLRDEWGCNVVRLAMYTAEGNGYCTGDAANRKVLRKLVKNGVKYAADLDMYVIVDWHILSDGNPNIYKKQAKSFFNYMSKKFKNNDHVIYEICNEPNGGTTWEDVRSYAVPIIKTIRKNDKDAIIIVGSPTWSQDVDIAAGHPLKGKNIMYSLHFYAATHKEGLRQKAQTAMDKGLPLFVTEFGFCDASGNGNIDKQESEKWIKYLNDNNISFCMWSLCNKAEAASAIKPQCSAVSGWKSSDISEAGKMLIKFLGGKAGGGNAGNSGGGEKGGNNENAGSSGSGEKGGKDEGSGNGDGGKSSGASNEKSVTINGCKAKVKVSNSWADSENSFFQYSAAIENGDEMKAKKWKLKITFTHAFSLEQGWCGVYHKNGKTLTITPEEYNSKVKIDGDISDIGFIIKSTAGNKIENLELTLK